jgi:hypothetical protein
MIAPLRLSCVAAAAILGAMFAVPASAQPRAASPPSVEREISVLNRSRRVINEIYVSPTAADDWGSDRLSEGVLLPGAAFRIRLGRIRDCGFDLQVIYDDGSREESSGHNACRTRQLAFDGSRAVAAPAAREPEHMVVLHNGSLRPIQQVFVSPADSQQWGDDLLTDSVIAVGGHTGIRYRGACVSDLRVVFDNRAAEERRGLDLCQLAELSIEPGWTTSDDVPVPKPAGARPDRIRRGDLPLPAGRRVQVSNRSGAALVELYVFADDADRGAGLDLCATFAITRAP